MKKSEVMVGDIVLIKEVVPGKCCTASTSHVPLVGSLGIVSKLHNDCVVLRAVCLGCNEKVAKFKFSPSALEVLGNVRKVPAVNG